MFAILLCGILGFLLGLAFVMKQRRIEPGKLLSATFLALLASGIGKLMKDAYKNKKRFHY